MSSEIVLSDEQRIAVDAYLSGKNVFITGPGGAGKTELLKLIYNDAKQRGKHVAITALTGCAAILLECKAKTIHSFSGIGLGKGDPDKIIKRVRNNVNKRTRWINTDVLIIDEVSMMSMRIFNLLYNLGQYCRLNNKPFGGIQLIFCGDFYQLPPVGNDDEPGSSQYCFESQYWDDTFPLQIELSHIFRQRDENYKTILNQIRRGVVTRNTMNVLKSCKDKDRSVLGEFVPTKIFPIRAKVDAINKAELKRISADAESRIFSMTRKYNKDRKDHIIEVQRIEKNVLCHETIELKVGCQVMCIVNIDLESDKPICNGSQGIIREFVSDNVRVEFYNGTTRLIGNHTWESEEYLSVSVSQIPLVLSWAITIHKSQGSTMDIAEVDVGKGVFAVGQTYVALSRVKTLDGLYLYDFDPHAVKTSKKVKDFYTRLKERLDENKMLEADAGETEVEVEAPVLHDVREVTYPNADSYVNNHLQTQQLALKKLVTLSDLPH